jgi:hypothetical protein
MKNPMNCLQCPEFFGGHLAKPEITLGEIRGVALANVSIPFSPEDSLNQSPAIQEMGCNQGRVTQPSFEGDRREATMQDAR